MKYSKPSPEPYEGSIHLCLIIPHPRELASRPAELGGSQDELRAPRWVAIDPEGPLRASLGAEELVRMYQRNFTR